MSTRNSQVLASFVAYCEAHPQLRFWQALRNWAEHNFILVSPKRPDDWSYQGNLSKLQEDLTDTFNWEGRNG